MILIGKNSLSVVLYKLLIVAFIIQICYFIFLLSGFAISFYNLETGNHFLGDNFTTGNFDDVKKIDSNATSFKFKMPFAESFTKGDFTIKSLVSIIFFLGFYNLFTFYIFKIFKALSKENIFTEEIINSLKQFAWINLIFVSLYFGVLGFIYGNLYNIDFVFILPHFSMGILIFFIVEFFKKGKELQIENDLTI